MEVSLSKKANEAKAGPKVSRRLGLQGMLSGVVLAATGGLALHRKGWELPDLPKIDIIPDVIKDKDYKPAVMFVVHDGDPVSDNQGTVMNSALILEACERVGVEYRCYNADADMFAEAQWVKDMHRKGVEFGHTCMVVVDRDGRGSVAFVPRNVPEALNFLAEKYNVKN